MAFAVSNRLLITSFLNACDRNNKFSKSQMQKNPTGHRVFLLSGAELVALTGMRQPESNLISLFLTDDYAKTFVSAGNQRHWLCLNRRNSTTQIPYEMTDDASLQSARVPHEMLQRAEGRRGVQRWYF